MKVVVTSHAIDQARERVWPGLPRADVRELLERFAAELKPVAEIDWAHDTAEPSDAFLVISDGIALPLKKKGTDLFVACTCLTRGGHSEGGKAVRRRRQFRRGYSQARSHRQANEKRPYDRRKAA